MQLTEEVIEGGPMTLTEEYFNKGFVIELTTVIIS